MESAEYLASLRKQHDEIVAKSAPLRERRDAIRAKIQPLEDEERKIINEIKKIEQPRLGHVQMLIRAVESVEAKPERETQTITQEDVGVLEV